MERIKKLIRSEAFRELFVYGVVGVLTTAVNYAVYFVVTRLAALIAGAAPDHAALIAVGNVLSWIASVAFAFWANKKYVFRSADWGKAALKKEIPGFVAARLFSLALDIAIVELMVHAMGVNDLIAKLVSNVVVIIVNYFLSKFWIFRKKGEKQ